MHFRSARAGLTLSAFLGLSFISFSQRPPQQPNAAEILHKMQKLNVLGSVLYIVAHPDDENTRLITWLANGKKVRTGNLSLTRGEGGQNLIGPELGDALGIIRTQELLEARRIDGGEQFFTRAVDFGYSKTAEESFAKWGKEQVLADVVRVIRTFRPDVIITRFPTDGGGGHGHHTASAILAQEAFDLAGDPRAFPEQLMKQGLEVWQPRRLFFNGSSWWRKDVADLAKTDPDWFSVDVGGYDALLGLSYTEIAGRSRSMHKSQGFGAAETRGEMLEYLHLEKGDRPKTKDIFEGIDMTWSKVSPSASMQAIASRLPVNFKVDRPDASIADLLLLHKAITGRDKNSDPQHWLAVKLKEVEALLVACSGLVVEVLSPTPTAITSETAKLKVVATNRSSQQFDLVLDGRATRLEENKTTTIDIERTAPSEADVPFWLENPHTSLYTIPDAADIGAADRPPHFTVSYELRFPDGSSTTASTPVLHRWVDRVKGEVTQPCHVVAAASVHAARSIVLVPEDSTKVGIGVNILADSLSGVVACYQPDGWLVSPMRQPFSGKQGDALGFDVTITKEQGSVRRDFEVQLGTSGGMLGRTQRTIEYDHIQRQRYTTPSFFRAIPLDVEVGAKTIGYVKGAGDEVGRCIELLGVTVEYIDPATASLVDLDKYDAIVTGIRAYNTVEAMKGFNAVLMQYVEKGGTLVCQYNTRSSDMMVPDSLFGPYPFKLTRDRVTVEEAPPTFLAKDHPLLNTPNKITSADFDGWVQERGLYFCGSLDPRYTPLIAWNDPGEQPLNGSLITCDHGKGRYVYTGISFFRQLPAGVPGAYRLFANLISRREAQ